MFPLFRYVSPWICIGPVFRPTPTQHWSEQITHTKSGVSLYKYEYSCSTQIRLGNKNLCGTEKNRYSKKRPSLMLYKVHTVHSSTDLSRPLYSLLQSVFVKHFVKNSVADPGCLSRIRIFPSRIRGQKDSRSRIRICI